MKSIYKTLLIGAAVVASLIIWENFEMGKYSFLSCLRLEERIHYDLGLVVMICLTLILVFMIWFGGKLIKWAKSRSNTAVIFGAVAHMVLPDPNVEKTIAIVQEQKQEKTKQDRNSEPKKGRNNKYI